LATASSSVSTALGLGWALLRGAKIASEYVRLYVDRQGKKKSGLAYLLKINDKHGTDQGSLSDWDRRDWRCSGFVDIPEPGFPLTERNRMLLADLKDVKVETVRRLFQMRTMSFAQFGSPRAFDKRRQ